jgi:hypothetical protein
VTSKLLDPQITTKKFGIDITFSYFGMHMFWPYIVSILLMVFLLAKKQENEYELMNIIEARKGLRLLLLALIPSISLFLHYATISEFFVEHLELAFRFSQNPQQGISLPTAQERIASFTIVCAVVGSVLLYLVALKMVFSKKYAPNN